MAQNPTRRAFLVRTGLAALAGGVAVPWNSWAAAKVGEAAPAFTALASTGRSVSLASYRSKIVVLEWSNHECPYVRKHYETGNMQALQKEATGQGVVWLTVICSAPGEQGYVRDRKSTRLNSSHVAISYAV